jgi:hypothetical protein
VSCGLVLLGIILAIIFVPNPGAKCGSRSLPNNFILHERELSISSFRHNVDVIGDTGDGTTGTIGEYYRKLITRKRTFRFLDTHEHIGASMVRENEQTGGEYTITACKSNDTYIISERTHDVQGTWELEFFLRKTSADGDIDNAPIIASSPRQLASSNTVSLRTTSDSTEIVNIVRGSAEYGDASWTVTVTPDALPAYVAGFFAIAVTDTVQYVDVDMSSSPSPTPSVSPTISFSSSPSPSPNSAISLSTIMAFAISLFACSILL